MRLQRRTFLTLLVGLVGMATRAGRVFAWPSWWLTADNMPQDSKPAGAAPPSATFDSSGVRFTTIRHVTPSDSILGFNRDPDVFYVEGDWRRWEMPRSYSRSGSQAKYGPRIVRIARPDLGKMFELNLDASEYTEGPYPPPRPLPLTKEQLAARGIKIPPSTEEAKPTYRVETTTKDMGERKEIFGFVARHVITTLETIPLEGSRSLPQESITDGWYIDLEPRLYPTMSPRTGPEGLAAQRGAHSYLLGGSGSSTMAGRVENPEKPEFVDIGDPERGFPIQEVRTWRNSYPSSDGSTGHAEGKLEITVTIEKAAYDPALFEVPAGFRQVQHIERNPR